VIGHAADRHRLPPLDLAVLPGDPLEVCGETVEVIDTPRPHVGHVSFHFPPARASSSRRDTLDGRWAAGALFEGTPAQMWDSLSRLRRLPPDTTVCSGHEYTGVNARYRPLASTAPTPALQARAEAVRRALPSGTSPPFRSLLSDEIATRTPFLASPTTPTLSRAMGRPDARRRRCVRRHLARQGRASADPSRQFPSDAKNFRFSHKNCAPGPRLPASEWCSRVGSTRRVPTHGNVIGLPEKTA
jgi:hydroxyacylglutathione hydrolase